MINYPLKAPCWCFSTENYAVKEPFLRIPRIIEFAPIIYTGLRANPPPIASRKRGRTKQSSTRNLLIRLRDHRDEILRFAIEKDVPFDNNLAERDLRMSKLKSKISGCFRSEDGVIAFCRIRSYVATARKRGVSMYESLVLLANDTPLSV